MIGSASGCYSSRSKLSWDFAYSKQQTTVTICKELVTKQLHKQQQIQQLQTSAAEITPDPRDTFDIYRHGLFLGTSHEKENGIIITFISLSYNNCEI